MKSPGQGLRLGLSRRVRVKPLHPSVATHWRVITGLYICVNASVCVVILASSRILLKKDACKSFQYYLMCVTIHIKWFPGSIFMGCFGHLYNLHLELLFHHHRSMLLSDCYQSSYCVRFFSDFSDCWHVEKFELSLFFFLTSLVICLPFVLLCERQCILCTYIIKSKRS